MKLTRHDVFALAAKFQMLSRFDGLSAEHSWHPERHLSATHLAAYNVARELHAMYTAMVVHDVEAIELDEHAAT